MTDTLDDPVKQLADYINAEKIVWCNGSKEEYDNLIKTMLADGSLIELNQRTNPGSYLHRSASHDVARTEHLTYICSEEKDDTGPTNNWMAPHKAKAKLKELFKDSMSGRTMYVVAFSMGPIGSPYSKIGVQITDSPYVVANIHKLSRIVKISPEADVENCMIGIHSLGDLDPDRRFIMHFPENRTVVSVGSGYGGNALLGKKCFALRIASCIGRDEGWLAEHMAVFGVEDPSGAITYMAAAFPSSCGKTNMAMLIPSLPGWKIHTVSDDLCWLNVGPDGRLWAINPEKGFFAVGPGTGPNTNLNMLTTVQRDTIFTNVGLTPDGNPWWEGLSDNPPPGTVDWQGQPIEARKPVAHPNSRFTVEAKQCPSASPHLENPAGVPISAILFGGRRADTIPLIFKAFDWRHGMYVGLTMASETTAAATGKTGVLRRDPYAMLPFTGYNMADSVAHRLAIGKRLTHPPEIFHINLFRRDENGKFLWPGFGENIRLLELIIQSINGKASFANTSIGLVPTMASLNFDGLNISKNRFEQLMEIDRYEWLKEMDSQKEFLKTLGERLPQEMSNENEKIIKILVA